MWDYKESWAPKNWCFWTVVLEKTLESPLDCKEIQPVHSKDQSWVFNGRTDFEAETPVLWPPDVKSWLIGKDPDAEGIGGRRRRGWQRMRRLDGITDSMDMNLSELREFVMDRESWHPAVHGVTKSWTRLSNWSELNWIENDIYLIQSSKGHDVVGILVCFLLWTKCLCSSYVGILTTPNMWLYLEVRHLSGN